MFCTKCGAEIIEGSKFCTRCGTPVVSVQTNAEKPPVPPAPPAPAVPPVPAAPETPVAPEAPAATAAPETASAAAVSKPPVKRLLVLGAIALAVIIAVALIFALKGPGRGFSSPEKAFDAYLGGYAARDFDLMLKSYPDFRVKYSGGEDILREQIAGDYENDFGRYPDNYQFIYKASGHTDVSEDERQDVENDINATFESDVKITGVATVDYDLTVKNTSDGTERTSSYTGGYAVEYRGKWYYFNVF